MLSIKSNTIIGHLFSKRERDSYIYVDIDSVLDNEWISYKEDKINLQNDLNNLKRDMNKAIKEYKKDNG
jgi:plasmid replication initiation protein